LVIDDTALIGVTLYLFSPASLHTQSANLLTLNSSKIEFILIGIKQQLAKLHDCSLNITHSACNLGFIFKEHLTLSNQISALSKSCCYSHIRELRCIRSYLDFKTGSTIATSRGRGG